ncbi:DUF1573 domain-containing protein [bacterium]|nr:DUF1573 domain-containing protein [bacterium]
MRPTGVILAVVFGFLALAVTVWIGRYDAKPPMIAAKPADPYEDLPVNENGPHPNAVAEVSEFNFGTMAVGNSGEHVFTIKNEGEGDLMLKKGSSTCSCTVGELSNDSKIAPGESVEVKLNWKIKAMTEVFRHSASVLTNDPEHREIQFVVTGKVDEPLKLKPATWEVGELSTDVAVMKGTIFSPVDDQFDIKNIVMKADWVKIESTPMTEEELKEYSAKSGYILTGTISPTMPIGPFFTDVAVETTHPLGGTLNFRINGMRPGPLEMFGPSFRPEANALILGEFAAKDGKSATISVFARDLETDLELEGAETEHNSVKVELVKDERLTGKAKRYLLKIEIPPGEPQDRMRKKSEKINLKFNHPEAKEVRLIVEFLAV